MNETQYWKNASADIQARLQIRSRSACPLVVLISHEDSVQPLLQACARQGTGRFHLLSIEVNSWDSDLTPWPADGLEEGTRFGGQASTTAQVLEEQILPWAEQALPAAPSCRLLAGYSLGGLFALWAGLQSRVYDVLLCVSGSLWYPGFADWVLETPVPGQLQAVYFSLGKKEVRTRNPALQQTGEIMETLCRHFEAAGRKSTAIWNPGTHFTEVPWRLARALTWGLQETGNAEDRGRKETAERPETENR